MSSAFDARKALRRLRPQRYRAPVVARPTAALAFAEDADHAGPPLVLDTCVYIHVLKGRTPSVVDRLLEARSIHHSATVVAELVNRFGSRIPATSAEKAARRELESVVADIAVHRTLCPTTTMWGEAGIVTGLRSRVGGFARGQDQDGLNDALILMQAIGIGAEVLTANVSDFDILQQIVPNARVLFYRET